MHSLRVLMCRVKNILIITPGAVVAPGATVFGALFASFISLDAVWR